MKHELRHPGEVLWVDYLEPDGISITEAASRCGLAESSLTDLIVTKIPLSSRTALHLVILTGEDLTFWLHLQHRWDMHHA